MNTLCLLLVEKVESAESTFDGVIVPDVKPIFSASCPYSSFNRRGETAGAIPLKVLFLKYVIGISPFLSCQLSLYSLTAQHLLPI